MSLGQYRFEKDGQGFVLVSNEGTDGHVIADAVQFLPVDELARAPPRTDAATVPSRDSDRGRRGRRRSEAWRRS